MLQYTLHIVPGDTSFLLHIVGNLSVKHPAFLQIPHFIMRLLKPARAAGAVYSIFQYYLLPRVSSLENKCIGTEHIYPRALGSRRVSLVPLPPCPDPRCRRQDDDARRRAAPFPAPGAAGDVQRGAAAGRDEGGNGAAGGRSRAAPPGAQPLRWQVSPPRRQCARCGKLRSDGWCAEG